MSLIELKYGDNGVYEYDREAVAIKRLQMFEPIALSLSPDGYYLADSGGKDSGVIKRIAEKSGVKFEIVHNHTGLDHPETVYFVRREKLRYEAAGIKYTISMSELSPWALMRKNKMPPTRIARYCCRYLKERGEGNTHPTVKPLKLIEYLINLVTPPNGTTLDPFIGSGTSAIAATNTGHNCIGFESDETNYGIATKRVCDVMPQMKLL